MIKLLYLILYNIKYHISNYNYYILETQDWCSKDYKIHGLWPQYNQSDYPTYCENVSYIEPSGELLNNMNKYWDSCENNSNLWKHEWEKHGSCMFNDADEYHYFNRTLGLYFEAEYYKYIQHNCTLNEQCLLPLNLHFQFIT